VNYLLPKKNLKLLMFAAEPLIFAPSRPSHAKRGEEIWFELFLEYIASLRQGYGWQARFAQR
jgi:hypothetical protein